MDCPSLALVIIPNFFPFASKSFVRPWAYKAACSSNVLIVYANLHNAFPDSDGAISLT